ncbi:Histidine phosphatase superfamily [Elaphomyces granulatus]|jgi:hypothetical protein
MKSIMRNLLCQVLALLSFGSLALTQETILGAFIFHRHGDRTSKFWPPARLTDLGATEVYESGTFYRNRYINGSSPINGIQKDIAKLSQLNIQAPVDIVLQPSAITWLQGLYPPVGTALGTQTLRNGTKVEAPLDGYQLIPVNLVTSPVSTSTNTENSVWLQGSSGCANAITSSNNYFLSQDYLNTRARTDAFYQGVYPVVNGSFTSAYTSYQNAYAVYDLIHVATINNATINSSNLLTPDTLFQLQTLADKHEFNLAYNSSDPIRAIAGSTLAAQILQQLNVTLTSQSAPRLSVQFGTYAAALSFFGLTQLPSVSENFTGIVDYASSMAFELITTSPVSSNSPPSPDDVSVRFMFSNGSAAEYGLTPYPLFGLGQTVLPWKTFAENMGKIAIGDGATWYQACGNTTGTCANLTGTISSSNSTPSSSGSGISTAVGGVIGAMVTLAVVLGLEALILFVGGLRIVNKKRVATSVGSQSLNSEKA